MKIAICPLQRGVTGMLQHLSSLVTSMQPQEAEFHGLLLPEGFMKEGCLQEDLLFVSSSLPTNRGVRLAWCRYHRDWSTDQWATVLFIDESRFSLTTDSRRTFI
ncbi:hypothetical protein AVEN_27277-1 [Araneus ventricosus]|uniref:Uncharacterized protein n=1 Tax=Araneus ventricosus TaxID=182803 RepID=A0A4Y2P716_ARAVE|nr:hypothetical protein AVEN_27277-1 [Araneus ventricosus]